MTVGVVAMARGMIFGASDRMLTAGDVQFEHAGTKVFRITNSIAMLTAGDASLNAEIAARVYKAAGQYLGNSPGQFQPIDLAVDFYIAAYNDIKSRNATAKLLQPLGLTLDQFFERHAQYDQDFVYNTIKGLQDFELPEVEAILTGIDEDGPHIFTVLNGESRCHDPIGFAAIGIGAKHAESHFMLSSLKWADHEALAALMTYVAKRRAEIAPGVGTITDMITIGPDAGSLGEIVPAGIEKMERLYQEVRRREARAERVTAGKMVSFYQELQVAKQSDSEGVPAQD